MLFSAMIGTGYQIGIVTFIVIVLAIIGELYTELVTISWRLTKISTSYVFLFQTWIFVERSYFRIRRNLAGKWLCRW